MNELELAQFAAPAAQALLTAMFSDGWLVIKSRLARVVAGRSEDVALAEENLDEMRRQIAADQDEGNVQRGQNEMFALLCTVLARNPEAITPLRELLSEVQASSSQVDADSISQSATVHGNAVNFQQISGTQNYRAN
ncbi:hypothetical protein [Streptomyces sp. R527F]|uniref:hypothetical protein n=1 Tax=Streptomyces sp. R527F TaxID=1664033 RepID=UPI001F1EE915|nr:hypothetical protein [Streptomyces sp. R527F]UIZ14151.1 hypothetical protein LZ559_17955 [Streptomyces sp. R527F]